jgi:hypothetical protein
MYPQRLYRTPGPDSVVANSDAERESAINSGYVPEAPAKEEYPKMVYLHPKDKTQEHKFAVVNNPVERAAAEKNGYQAKPHVPVTPEDTAYEGSGSERWGSGDWTQTSGVGLTSDTSPRPVPTQAEADAVAQKASADMAARSAELVSEGKPGVNEFPTNPLVATVLASEGKPGVNEVPATVAVPAVGIVATTGVPKVI